VVFVIGLELFIEEAGSHPSITGADWG
jgi:hypothetical protein